MHIEGWKYYNHAAIPSTAPHEPVNLDPVADGSIWSLEGKKPVLVRWAEKFDCGYETEWWYVIKDTPFDINELKSKRRYEITKGNKYFYEKEIQPQEYSEELYAVTIKAYQEYPEPYRPSIEHDDFIRNCASWNFYKVYAAFSVQDDTLCGYACLQKKEKYIDFCVMKSDPASESKAVNAALVNFVLQDNSVFLSEGGYICDGSRSINHETAFQDYLEKYFGFRKAFCEIRILYRFPFSIIVRFIYPFRQMLSKINGLHQVNAILTMESIAKKFR